MMQKHGIRSRLDVGDATSVCVEMDRYLYERIVFNLLSNAVKFTPAGGEITLRLERPGDRIRLSVQDTGIGIRPEDQPLLFKRFQQVEGAATRRFEGVGLGLALVKEFSELLGGNVSVESRANEGSTFTVECLAPTTTTEPLPPDRSPVVSRSVGPGIAAAEIAPHELETDRLYGKVLIVENNQELARYIALALSPICEPRVVTDGDEALAVVKAWGPSVILSDVMMPRRDGLSLCRELKSDPETCAIPVILLSALTYHEALLRGWEAGADDYLFKPFHPAELVTRMRVLLATQARLRAEKEARLLAERALTLTSRQLAEAQHIAHVGSWEWDLEANRLAWSDELYRLFGLDRAKGPATYEDYLTRVHPEDASRTHETIQTALEKRAAFSFEHRVIRAGGEIAWIHGRGNVYLDDDGRPLRMAGTAHEITERKEAEESRLRLAEAEAARTAAEQAREQSTLLARENARLYVSEQGARQNADRASRAKDDFLATISHELRTPLNAMLGWTRLLRMEVLPVEKRERTIERNARTQAKLIEDLLDVSRIIAGKLRLELRPVDLQQVAELALENARLASQAKDIHVAATIAPDLGPVIGDPGRLQQVIWNLLSNAVKFTGPGGRVELALERIDSRARLVVADTGDGIKPDFLPCIFERFSQADGTPTRAHGGLGIGLAISREIVELHGGRIEVASAGEGKGSTFTVWLALAEPASPLFGAASTPPPPPHAAAAPT